MGQRARAQDLEYCKVGGLQRKDPSVAVDLDAPPPTARILGLHDLAADAIELGLLLERVDFDVCAATELRRNASGTHRALVGGGSPLPLHIGQQPSC